MKQLPGPRTLFGHRLRARIRRLAVPAAIGVAALVAIGVAAVAGLIALATDMPSAEDLAKDPLPLATKVYAADGATLLYEFAEERREPVRFDELPRTLIDATVSAEDRTFWSNPGIDVPAIVRAAFENVQARRITQGASTITQQLIRARMLDNERTLARKAREALLAVEVSRRYSKQEILELYFNQIYYGAQAYGVKAAARVYFGTTDLSKLTLGQAALLAGLPQSPSTLDPTKPENRDLARQRRAYVLDQMVRGGYVTPAQADTANKEPVEIGGGAGGIRLAAPHFVFQVKRELARILGSEAAVTRGGYTVVTSVIPALQQEAEQQVRAHVDRLRSRNVNNAALVSMDPRTGQVLAYVGSVDYRDTADAKVQGQYDAAGIGARQPGSAFKIFTYLTALKRGATAATVVVDARTDFGGGYRPENADLQYHGPVTMRQALRESRNVPAVKFLQQHAGIDETIRTARDLGITADFEGSAAGLSLTLGSVPVRLVDMTRAFGAVANGGERIDPQLVMKVHDPRGKLIFHFEPARQRVLSQEVAWLMTDILKDTTQPDRSFMFGPWTNLGRPAALKTGTTDDMKDVYSVGYTPQIVTGVWMGNSDGTPMSSRDLSSAMGPGQLWRDFMRSAHTLLELKPEDWPRPAGIVSAEVAVAPGAFGGYGSGLLPTAASPFRSTENFVRGTAPTKPDDWSAACPAAAVAGREGAPERATRMVIKEAGPAAWARDRERWIREAMAGAHDYGRFPWSRILSIGDACPSPAPSASPSVSPSGRPSPTAPGRPSPTLVTPLPSVTLPPLTPPPPPARTPAPTPTPRG